MPAQSSTYGEWNSSRYLQWARHKGPNVVIVVEKMFHQGPEQQYYRRAHSLLKLADRYSDQRLDQACQLALEKSTTPSYSLVKRLLETMDSSSASNTTQEQAYLRGADYYDKQDF